jgi:uncharacterized protein (TIGR02145 family)
VNGDGVTDANGNTYQSVIIGTQEWMTENLRTSKYSDGTTIPNVTGDTEWGNLSTGATDTDTVNCTFAISGIVNSRRAGWTQIRTVVGGVTYGLSTSGGTKTFTPGSGPESGQTITTVVYNTESGNSVSLSRHRYYDDNAYYSTLTNYDVTPHGWTGLSGSGYEKAPVLGFMAFVDKDGNGLYDSGTDDFIRDINTLSITPVNSGELYLAFYDNGDYTDNSGLINIIVRSELESTEIGQDSVTCAEDSILLDKQNSHGWCHYDNDSEYEATYGKLYNWYAVNTDKLCPTGWHVPTDAEWTVLTDYLAADGHIGPEGKALKATSGWNSGGNGTDDYGWLGLPGGLRGNYDGNFYNFGFSGYWWSSSQSGTASAWGRNLSYGSDAVDRNSRSKGLGFSVRCLRD